MPFRRGASMLVTYVLTVLFLYMLSALVLPQVWTSVAQLVADLPRHLAELSLFADRMAERLDLNESVIDSLTASYETFLQQAADAVTSAMPRIVGVSIQIGKSLVSAFTAIIASVYFLADKERLLFQCKKVLYALLPLPKARRTLFVFRRANSVFSGFIGGKLLDSLIIGVLCFFGMQLISPSFAMLIRVLVGLTNVIPVFGPFIGAIPSILLLLMVEPLSALWFALFILLLQQLDGNVIGPKILGDSTGLSALWVLVAIVVGGGLFGFAGMLVGVPVCSVLYYLAGEFINGRLSQRGLRARNGRIEPRQEDEQENAAHEEEL